MAGSETAAGSRCLYVWNLHPDVDENVLFQKFSRTNRIESIRVCRHFATHKSLGYGFVKFYHPTDAERVLNTMNYDVIKGRPMRIMWAQPNPSLGNIFIKNLDVFIDNKSLYDTFSAFGTVLSCKMIKDQNGISNGYGFVHFETEESAKKAIATVDGMFWNGQKVFVGPFTSRKEREQAMDENASQLSDNNDRQLFESLRQIWSSRENVHSLSIAAII